MPTTPLQRMMFIQGQLCFFCNRTIPRVEASVEHLVPSSAGGSDHPDNLVACCKTLNALFGSMSVKDKMRAILKQHGQFVCPNQTIQSKPKQVSAPLQQPQTPVKAGQSNSMDASAPANHGKSWTPAEDKQLANAFDARTSIPELAKIFKRGVGGIHSRLTKLGKLTPESQTTYPPKSK